MSQWLWCGVLVMLLGAGLAASKQYWMPARPVTVAMAPRSSELSRFPAPLPSATAPATPLPTAPQVDDVHEPIVTRPELLEAIPEMTVALPTVGGAEESAVSATRAPRPDRETRLMPYADDDEIKDLLVQVHETHGRLWDFNPQVDRQPADVLSWSGLVRWALQLDPRDMAGAEESEEPPLLQPVLPSHYHPPHCPYGGHCPYPHPYHYVQPR